MAARDLKLTATLNDQISKGIDGIVAKVRSMSDRITAAEDRAAKARVAIQRQSLAYHERLQAQREKEYSAWWARSLKTQETAEQQRIAIQRQSAAIAAATADRATKAQETAERQRIALQRQSLALAEQQAAAAQSRLLLGQRNSLDAATRIQRQAAIAESALVLDKFDRQIAKERAAHSFNLQSLKTNTAAREAEIRRHNAVVSRIQMDKGNFANTPFQQLLGGVKQGIGFQNTAASIGMMAGGALAATSVFYGLSRGIRSSVDVAMQLDTVTRSLQFATGSAKAGAEEFQFLREESQRLGFSLIDSAGQFAQMAAAARGTMIQGQGVRDIFTGVAQASTVLGMSADQTSGALRAIQQMISKGTVQAEELRGQLGERLPGAFQIAARAMGVSTRELGKMLELGQVSSDEFLPKFAKELQKTFGEDAVKAADGARASITKMHNSIAEGAGQVGGVFVGVYAGLAKAYLAVAENTSKAAEAQARYNTARMGGMGGPPKEDPTVSRALETAKRMDTMNLFQQKAEQDADAIRQKNQAEEFKEQKKTREKAAEDAKREAERVKNAEIDLSNQIIEARRDRNIKLRDLAKEANSPANQSKIIADIANTEAIYAKRDADAKKVMRDSTIGAMGSGPAKAIEESKARQQDELAAFNLSQEARTMGFENAEKVRTEMAKRYADERKAIAAAENDAILAAGANLANGVGGLLQVMAGKNRTMAKAGMRITQAGAIASTAAGVMKAFEQGGVLGFLTGAGIAAEGAVQVGTIEKQINRFAQGTHSAPGGWSIVGEQGPEMAYLPRGSRVETAAKTREMSGGFTHSGPVNIVVQAAPGTTPAQAEAMGAQAAVGYRNELRRFKQMERDARDLRITA